MASRMRNKMPHHSHVLPTSNTVLQQLKNLPQFPPAIILIFNQGRERQSNKMMSRRSPTVPHIENHSGNEKKHSFEEDTQMSKANIKSSPKTTYSRELGN
ncbi:Receptor-like protein kinase [Corchorus olitorius]|uniref:Receptor-like protein kinase n=1 Tax=Corchorus olitorius TaxID=93759 RepID=A0A1R3IAC3_9ROSI|nr:Receptor-like protein kinase [Corchorus olitorius]